MWLRAVSMDGRPGQTVRDLQAMVKTLAPTPSEMGGLGHGSGMVQCMF